MWPVSHARTSNTSPKLPCPTMRLIRSWSAANDVPRAVNSAAVDTTRRVPIRLIGPIGAEGRAVTCIVASQCARGSFKCCVSTIPSLRQALTYSLDLKSLYAFRLRFVVRRDGQLSCSGFKRVPDAVSDNTSLCTAISFHQQVRIPSDSSVHCFAVVCFSQARWCDYNDDHVAGDFWRVTFE